jgi:hypothetical protein
VLAHGHQTELETLFDFGFYNYAAPDGAENESQRNSNPSAQDWRAATTLGNRSPNSSTLKELNQIHRRTDATPSELSAIQSFTRRSPMASANAGLNDSTPTELNHGSTNSRPASRAKPLHASGRASIKTISPIN